MKKSSIFIVLLLCIVVAELIMVFKNGTNVGNDKPVLDTKVYDMPIREAENKTVKPFLFELHSANEVDAILDEFAADISRSLTNTKSEAQEHQIVRAEQEKMLVSKGAGDNVLFVQDEALTAHTKTPAEDKTVSGVAESMTNIVEENEPSEKKEESSVDKGNQTEQTNGIGDKMPENLLPIEEKTTDTKVEEIEEEKLVEKDDNDVEVKASGVQSVEKNKQSAGRVKIAIVIDDVGLSIPFTKQISQVKAPLTVSFLPYGASNKEQVMMLKNAGFEVMVHIPMMPHIPAALAPITLSPEMDKAETQTELNKMLDRFEGTGMSGVNNHMGSLLTERVKNMEYVMEVLKKRGLFFLDSKTTGKSMARKAADEYGVTYISRDVFLDNKNEYNYIMGQFKQAEKVALKNGYAVAIGHPYSQTLKVLQDWLPNANDRGFEIVHISELLPK
ncbi:MAG: divergent polysaccharide deacetylase family protein [Alphaproteobacteria bacterium]|nr:divergent polysaccharide deacetylase family protein [Alphaproteobacteria bacterium]